MDSFSNYISKIIWSLQTGYTIIVPVILLLIIFYKKEKDSLYSLLDSANTIGAGICLLIVLVYIDFLSSQYLTSSGSWNLNKQPDTNRRFSSDEIIFSLASLIFFIVYLFRPARKSIIASLIFIVIINWNSAILIAWNLFRDYIPSSWSVYYNDIWHSRLFSVFLFAGLTILVYYLKKKKQAL
jgi:hypothetical protein